MSDSEDVLDAAVQKIYTEVRRAFPARVALQEKNRFLKREQLVSQVALEEVSRNQIDDFCNHWILNGKFPSMDQDMAVLVADRFAEALSFGGFLHLKGFRASGKTEREVLEFLLVETWEPFGLRRLQARLIS